MHDQPVTDHAMQLTLAQARVAIVRKFTNHITRNVKPSKNQNAPRATEALMNAASVLFDLNWLVAGRRDFYRRISGDFRSRSTAMVCLSIILFIRRSLVLDRIQDSAASMSPLWRAGV